MVRPPVHIEPAIRAFLVAQSSIVDLVTDRVYGGVDLPPGYRPVATSEHADSGAAIIVLARAPIRFAQGAFVRSHIYVRCFAATEIDAFALDAAVLAVLDSATISGFRNIWQAVPGEKSRTEQGWPFLFSTYESIT